MRLRVLPHCEFHPCLPFLCFSQRCSLIYARLLCFFARCVGAGFCRTLLSPKRCSKFGSNSNADGLANGRTYSCSSPVAERCSDFGAHRHADGLADCQTVARARAIANSCADGSTSPCTDRGADTVSLVHADRDTYAAAVAAAVAAAERAAERAPYRIADDDPDTTAVGTADPTAYQPTDAATVAATISAADGATRATAVDAADVDAVTAANDAADATAINVAITAADAAADTPAFNAAYTTADRPAEQPTDTAAVAPADDATNTAAEQLTDAAANDAADATSKVRAHMSYNLYRSPGIVRDDMPEHASSKMRLLCPAPLQTSTTIPLFACFAPYIYARLLCFSIHSGSNVAFRLAHLSSKRCSDFGANRNADAPTNGLTLFGADAFANLSTDAGTERRSFANSITSAVARLHIVRTVHLSALVVRQRRGWVAGSDLPDL